MTTASTAARCAIAALAGLSVLLTASLAFAAPETEQRMIDKRFGNQGRAVVAFDQVGSNLFDDAFAAGEQSDGKIVIAGTVALPGGRTGIGVTRLNRDGSRDTGFGNNGRVVYDTGGSTNAGANALAIQNDDRIVVTGWINGPGLQGDDYLVVRFNANGGADLFGTGGRSIIPWNKGGSFNDWATGVAVQDDGKIVVAGNLQRGTSATDRDIGVVRLNADGLIDSAFGVSGKQEITPDQGGGNDDQATGVVIQSNGKIVVGGWSTTASHGKDILAARLLADGAIDTAFGNIGDGVALHDLPVGDCTDDEAIAIDAVSWSTVVPTVTTQRRILLAGTTCRNTSDGADDWDFALVRLLDDGSLDTTLDGAGWMAAPMDLGGINRDLATGVAAIKYDGFFSPFLAPSHIVLSGFALDTRVPGDRGYQFAIRMLEWDGSYTSELGLNGWGYVDFDLGGSNNDWGNALVHTRRNEIVVAGTAARENGDDHDFAATRIILDRIFAGDQEND